MKIYIADSKNGPALTGITAVPDGFLERNLAGANGEFVKVYLLLLRFAADGTEAGEDMIAERLQVTVKDVRRALGWWEEHGELKLRPGDGSVILTPYRDGDDDHEAGAAQSTDSAPQNDPPVTGTEPPETEGQPSGQGGLPEAKTRPCDLKGDPEFAEVLAVVERYVGKKLSSASLEKIAWWYADMKVPADLIEFTVESCVEAGHSSMRYIESVIVGNWQEGVRTREQLQERNRIYRSDFYKILRAFGISRQPIPRETSLMKCWISEYGFSVDIISEAAGRAAYKEDPFKYADSILKDWHKADVRTKKDIEALDEKHRQSSGGRRSGAKQASAGRRRGFDNFEQREFDSERLDKVRRRNEQRWEDRSAH